MQRPLFLTIFPERGITSLTKWVLFPYRCIRRFFKGIVFLNKKVTTFFLNTENQHFVSRNVGFFLFLQTTNKINI